MIVGIDAGNHEVKVVGPLGEMKFLSDIGGFYERNYKVEQGDCDMEVEYKGVKYFAGSLARAESETGGSIKGMTKAHPHARLRVLIALHQYSDEKEYQIIVGQPIKKFTEPERDRIREMLVGKHKVTVNGVTKQFEIVQCGVAIEAGSAYWSDQSDGTVRIVDLGSATINLATMVNHVYRNRESDTIPFGYETLKNKEFAHIADSIAAKATEIRWDYNDTVLVAGGISKQLVKALNEYFPNARAIEPTISINVDGNVEHRKLAPVYANAAGFFFMAQQIYGGVHVG